MKDFDAVVFDMDGVIFDSERAMYGCWQALAEKYALEGIDEVYRKIIGMTDEVIRQVMEETYAGKINYREFMDEAFRNYRETYMHGGLEVKPGVVEILQFLKDHGKKIALASSSSRRLVESELRSAGLLDFFDALVTGEDVARSKPAPDIFLKACEEIGTAPGRTFAIEDSYNGIRSASSGGLRALMVPDLLPANEEMERLAEAVFPTLFDVIAYFEKP